ncbi:MAG: maleylpyruvate isomerase family mycothiol-dependent enzyme [Acidobacteria bacterium]|nr:maleylpyruvate isomerase family mycothiol-dependent enzyme [Acidobacteriota bacterium]
MTTDGLPRPSRPSTPSALLGDLRDVWVSIDDLLASLDDEDLAAPTACPGWDVAAVLAHVIGTELMMAGEAPPAVDVPDLPHLRNEIARANEAWILARRDRTPDELRAEFREVVARRTEELGGLTQSEFDAESWTPAGQATLGRFLQIRVFDTWIHELDIRDAVGRVGHETGPAVQRTLAEVGNGIGFVVGKRAGAPEGSWVRIDLPGPEPARFDVVVEGRARVVEDEPSGDPTVTVTLGSTDLVRCIAGRVDPAALLAAGTITLGGDVALGERIVSAFPYTI